MVGLCLGYVSLAIFLIFAVVKIVIDEYKRHKKYAEDVRRANTTLSTRLDQTEEDLAKLMRDFAEDEKRGGKAPVDDDDAALIN